MLRPNFLLLMLTTFALLMGGAQLGCVAHTPPATNGDDDVGDAPIAFEVDWDLFVSTQAEQFRDHGEAMVGMAVTSDEDTAFNDCIFGVVEQGIGDGTIAWGVPLKQAIEEGATSGVLAGFVIDPSVCIGLPGTPATPAELDAKRAEVERVCLYASPFAATGLQAGSLAAAFNGDVEACVWLKASGDAVGSACELTVATLDVIEYPGNPWYGPDIAWNAAWCGA